MKKLNFFLASAATATLMLTACSDKVDFTEDSVLATTENSDGNAVQFSTYVSSSGTTRAGSPGAIDDTKLKASGYGFGVFAYYTGTKDYSAYNYNSASKNLANFMYNQEVKWQTGSAYENYVNGNGVTGDGAGAWIYTPIKYWPNEVQNNAATPEWKVDDQDNDAADNQATGSGTYGGKVSYFAYAPYVEANSSMGNTGIVAINGATDLTGVAASSPSLGTGGQKLGDPTITYVLTNDGNTVDLLWGTAGTNGVGVTGAANTGSAVGTGTQKEGGETSESNYSTTHVENLLKPYHVNTDLTKQKTNGTINFLFKHALSKVGGSSDITNYTDEAKHGLMVILDLDDFKGAEQGGVLNTGQTKVTINSVEITNDLNGNGSISGQVNGIDETIKNKGVFNLATGKWSNLEPETTNTNGLIKHTIYPDNNSETGNAVLNPAIAELLGSGGDEELKDKKDASSNYTDFFSNSNSFNGQIGVQTSKPLAVYKDENNPLVFIPGTKPALKITVDYYVRTKDELLKKGYSEVRQKISKIIQFDKPVELNKQYSLLMHLGLTSVKFTASVSDWELSTVDDGNVPSTQVVDITEVNVPINVAGVKSYKLGSGTEISAESPEKISFVASASNEKILGVVTLNMSDGTTPHVSSAGGFSVSVTDGITASFDNGSLKVNFNSDNTGTTKKTGTVTVTYGTSSINIPVEQAAGALDLSSTSISTSDYKTITLSIKDAGSHDVHLAKSSKYKVTVLNNSDTELTLGTDYTLELSDTENKIILTNAIQSGEKHTIEVSVNDTAVASEVVNGPAAP